jgi:hypothetical protein
MVQWYLISLTKMMPRNQFYWMVQRYLISLIKRMPRNSPASSRRSWMSVCTRQGSSSNIGLSKGLWKVSSHHVGCIFQLLAICMGATEDSYGCFLLSRYCFAENIDSYNIWSANCRVQITQPKNEQTHRSFWKKQNIRYMYHQIYWYIR